MIELIDFGKDYGDFRAVEALNLKIGAGEMFGFIGPNGAGKSTTIRFLATLLKASRGEGIVNGHPDPVELIRAGREDDVRALIEAAKESHPAPAAS